MLRPANPTQNRPAHKTISEVARWPVTAIQLANVLDHELQPSSEEILLTDLDHEYLARMRLANFPDRWRESCRGGV